MFLFVIALITSNVLAGNNISNTVNYTLYQNDTNVYICGNNISNDIYMENVKTVPYSHYHKLIINNQNELYLIDNNNPNIRTLIGSNITNATASKTKVYYNTVDRIIKYYDLTTGIHQQIMSPVTTVYMAAGQDHMIFNDINGNIYTVGNNTYGQLGTNDFSHRTRPQLVAAGSKVAAGTNSSYWIARNGYVYGVGDNKNYNISESALLNIKKPTITISVSNDLASTETSITGKYTPDGTTLRQRGLYDNSTLVKLTNVENYGLFNLTELHSNIDSITMLDELTREPVELINGQFVPVCDQYEQLEKDCKPGHGHGDKNHCHSGPPGKNK